MAAAVNPRGARQYPDAEFRYLALDICSTVRISISNTVFYYIYTLKLPFFERYRINPDSKWPWEEEDKKVWTNLAWKIKVAVSHDLLLQFGITYLSLFAPIDFKWSLEDFPSTAEIML